LGSVGSLGSVRQVRSVRRVREGGSTLGITAIGPRSSVTLAAGIDGIQHPEILDGRDLPDDIVSAIKARGIICSMLVSTITGPAWQRHLKTRDEAMKKVADAQKDAKTPARQHEERQRRGARTEGFRHARGGKVRRPRHPHGRSAR
jgi:hypothetical protein